MSFRTYSANTLSIVYESTNLNRVNYCSNADLIMNTLIDERDARLVVNGFGRCTLFRISLSAFLTRALHSITWFVATVLLIQHPPSGKCISSFLFACDILGHIRLAGVKAGVWPGVLTPVTVQYLTAGFGSSDVRACFCWPVQMCML